MKDSNEYGRQEWYGTVHDHERRLALEEGACWARCHFGNAVDRVGNKKNSSNLGSLRRVSECSISVCAYVPNKKRLNCTDL